MAARGQHPGGTTIPCFLLQASSRTGAGIGEVPSRFWSKDGVDSCSNESGDHDPSHLFRVILLRRLRQALPLSLRNCRCGLPFDVSGHHRAACARAGMLGRLFVRDMDLDVPVNDGRRLEVDGLPLHGGAQFVVDTTLVCALHADGRPRRRSSEPGWGRAAGRQTQEGRHVSGAGRLHSRAKLVVLGVQVGGRWSDETRTFLSQLAKRARTEMPLMRRRADKLGDCGGEPCWCVRQPRQWLLRC